MWCSGGCSWKCYKTLTFCSLLATCRIPCTCHAKRHLNIKKCSEIQFFTLLTSKCASRHNGVHFFNISTSKSGPTMVCFVHFDFEMCFAPQRRALFRHRNFQKWSDHGVFCTFWLRNVLRATPACTFSTSQLPKVVRDRQFFTLLTWKCASRHNGVQLFISHLPRCLRSPALASLLFNPPEPQISRKTQWIATFLPFRASPSSFFLLFLFYSSFFLSFSSLCLFPALLFICPYCRKFDF